MIGPIHIPALGVDALPNDAAFGKVTSWTWTHPTNGIQIDVHSDEAYRRWVVVLKWRGIRVEERDGDMSDVSDAYEVATQHAHAYVPRLYAQLRHLESDEEVRQTCERSRLEAERAEAEDEVSCGE